MSRHTAHKIGGKAWRSCAKKQRYATDIEAQKTANAAMKNRPNPPLRVYDCAHCDGWHITHKPRGDNS